MRIDRYWPVALLLVFVAMATPGCQLIADIFQAGVWVGVIMVVVVIAIIIFLFRMLAGRRG